MKLVEKLSLRCFARRTVEVFVKCRKVLVQNKKKMFMYTSQISVFPTESDLLNK